jgi:hypothetical protein
LQIEKHRQKSHAPALPPPPRLPEIIFYIEPIHWS